MVRVQKFSIWKLVVVGLLAAVHAYSAEPSYSSVLKKAVKMKLTRWGTVQVLRPIIKDVYKPLIQKGLVPKVSRALLRLDQNYGGSPAHKLARTWHFVLMLHLTAVRIPESWKKAAAVVHKKLGGRGELIRALPDNKRGRTFNLNSGPLREEFLSYAMFFLKTFVPDDINACASKELTEAEECVSQYEEELQTALLATFSSFFHYVIPRTPSSRIATTSFVFAAISPCPFGYLVEPGFVARALQGAPRESLTAFASIKRVSSAKPCPEHRKALLRVLLMNGVTPADMIKAKKFQDELGKITASVSSLVAEEAKQVIAATMFDRKSLVSEATGGDASPEEVLAQLAAYIEELTASGVKGSLSSRSSAGQKEQQASAGKGPSLSAEYLDRLKVILEGESVSAFKPQITTMKELVKSLSEAIAAEAKANPHRASLKPEKQTESLEEEAQEVLKQMRNFSLQTSKFLEDDKGQ